ncbi:MAG TPA: hypothetical protein VGG96_08770 [Steroidobacteraceae bacterium]
MKSKGGAAKGNRNALKTGYHTEASLGFHRAVFAYVRAVKAEMALLRSLLPPPRTRILYTMELGTRCYARTRLSGRPPATLLELQRAAARFPVSPPLDLLQRVVNARHAAGVRPQSRSGIPGPPPSA